MRTKRAVRDICSIKLKFRDGSPIYRNFMNPQKTVRVVNIPIQDENGKKWAAQWRVARNYEPEWWLPSQRGI